MRTVPPFSPPLSLEALARRTMLLAMVWPTASVGNVVLQSPSLNQVASTVLHAYYIIEEQRERYSACVDRQSIACDAEFSSFATTADEDTAEKLASTAVAFEVRDSQN